MYEILKNELLDMNKEYVEMFENKIYNGMYIVEPSSYQKKYSSMLHQYGYKNIESITSIEQIDILTIKDYSIVILGLKGSEYIEFAIKLIELGLCWENLFAENDVIYFIKCLNLYRASENEAKTYIEQEFKLSKYYQEIKLSYKKIKRVYDNLIDDLSKKVLLRCVLKKIFDCSSYLDIYSPDQYVCDILKFTKQEIVVDVGAYNGDTVKLFAENIPGYCHMYAFEPETSSFNRLIQNTKYLKNIDYFSVGLADFSGVAQFYESDFGASTFVNTNTNISYEKLVLCGDDLNMNPTFIKMDIEGFELEALKGFRRTIHKYKPKLAVCVYHKFQDIYDIPIYLNKICPHYEIFFRHHSSNSSETVLYAIDNTEIIK